MRSLVLFTIHAHNKSLHRRFSLKNMVQRHRLNLDDVNRRILSEKGRGRVSLHRVYLEGFEMSPPSLEIGARSFLVL